MSLAVKKEDYFLGVDDPTTSFKVETPNKQKIVDAKCNKQTQIVDWYLTQCRTSTIIKRNFNISSYALLLKLETGDVGSYYQEHPSDHEDDARSKIAQLSLQLQ